MSDERIHPPTPRRREEARVRGHVARSADLTGAAALLAGVLALQFGGEGIVNAFASHVRASLSRLHELTPAEASGQLFSFATTLAPIVGIILLAAVAAGVAQVGLIFTMEPLAPRAERLAPAAHRLFSLSKAAAGLLKVGAVLAVLGVTLWGERARLVTAGHPAAELARVALLVAVRGSVALLALGLLDYAWQRWRHEQSLRMTPQEWREEMRREEGDPQVRERRRRARRELAQGSISMVLTGPGGVAVAIAYEPDTMRAPRVVGKGAAFLERARRQNVPVVEAGEVAATLFRRTEVGGSVPADLYQAVADVMVGSGS